MVCLGNICRSPVADGLMRLRSTERNLNVTVDSCGTGNYHIGEAPDLRSQTSCQVNGVDISMLKARQFHTDDFETFDHILCMDQKNLKDILALARNEAQASKVHLFMDGLHPDSPTDVPDPYFGGQDGFKKVFHMVDEGCHAWLDKWTES